MRRTKVMLMATGCWIGMLVTALGGCGAEAASARGWAKAELAEASPSVMANEVDASAGSMQLEASTRSFEVRSSLTLRADDAAAAAEAALSLVKRAGGRVASLEERGRGPSRFFQIELKLPLAQHDELLAELRALGEVQSVQTSSVDVTAEVIDLDARLKAARTLEQRLLELLQQSGGEMATALQVSSELERVQARIEALVGQQRAMEGRTTMAHLSLRIAQEWSAVPVEEPDLDTEAGRAWNRSLVVMGRLGKALLLGAIAIVPWLPFLLLPCGLWVWLRRRKAS